MMINNDDDDYRMALEELEREFPGLRYDASMKAYLERLNNWDNDNWDNDNWVDDYGEALEELERKFPGLRYDASMKAYLEEKQRLKERKGYFIKLGFGIFIGILVIVVVDKAIELLPVLLIPMLLAINYEKR
jgi:hypothetical protein